MKRFVAGLASAIFVFATPAFASPAARLVYLRGTGAESCPDENAIKKAVEARLGYDPFVPYATTVIIAEITREAGTYKARIKLVDENNVVRGTRELTHKGDKCAEMVDTMALTMSIAIDPDSLTGPKPKPPEKADDPEPVPAPPPEPPPVTPNEPPITRDEPPKAPARSKAVASKSRTIDVGLGPTGFVGAGPAASLGGAAFVRARWRHASIGVEARGDLPARREIEGAAVETAVAFGTIVPCAHAGWAFACAVASIGSIRASSSGIRDPRSDSGFHAATGLRIGVELPEGAALRVFANATGLMTLTPQVIALDGRDVYELPRFSAGLSAGLVVSIF